ncbi:heterokaryon incompatibility protein-domain-containing protein [Colletotrichum phormii]|uniref:Heterokaryon incompatibility protein-domain-containing protein n=1 Tax=Colletotrichum phormii TaxID=359342 RepID=A0AAJ0EBE5_9PEZI|nr:heterokaryon incompatibility protein-domain-containing protein [Colletotrichum phormii]KAK1623582.1 heterokaryon incompatibility protein-domain-containing protein [Colletotrichum phormii]
MSRWHERGCGRPDVVVCSGLPCCQSCYAVASTDDVQFETTLRIPQAPVLENDSTHNLRWPACVDYLDSEPGIPPTTSTSLCPGPKIPSGRKASSCRPNVSSKKPSASSKDPTTTDERPLKRRRLLVGDEPYQPSRCYTILCSDEEIRILELEPGNSDSLLHANFRNVRLDSERATYEALSYTWADSSGESHRCRPMFIGSYWDVIPITRNCEDALRTVRLDRSSRSIWADSLCINQDDDEERNAQVALMSRIYDTATGVLAYLGPATDDSDKALSAILNSTSRGDCGHRRGERKACADCELPIRVLLDRPYFRRLWVVQEVVLSRTLTLYCGSKSTRWPSSEMLSSIYHDLHSWITTWQSATTRPLPNFLKLMMDTCNCLCKDPRDKVFALLGLVWRWNRWPVFPDYRLTVEEVSIGIAAYLTQRCGLGKAVLVFAGANRARRVTLPSWVPDILVPFCENRGIPADFERLWMDESTGGGKAAEFHNMGSLTLLPLSPYDIRIMSRSGHLKVTAIEICNLREFFTEKGQFEYRQPFVRHGSKHEPKMKASLLFPKPSPMFPDTTKEIDISQHIQQQDGIFWLHGVNGYAVLRPICPTSTYHPLCACDLVFENPETPQSKDMSFKPFTQSDSTEPEKQKKNLIEEFRLMIEDNCVARMSELPAKSLLLKLATYINRHGDDSKIRLWKIWKQHEVKLKPYLEDERGIALLLRGITEAQRITLGRERDGSPRQAFLYKGCILRSPKAISTLLWSLLPRTRQRGKSSLGADNLLLSVEEVLKGFQEWADVTSDLVFATAHSIEYEEESLFGLRSCLEIQEDWFQAFESFRRSKMSERSSLGSMEIIADVLTWFPLIKQELRQKHSSVYINVEPESMLGPHTRHREWSGYDRNQMWNWELVGHNFREMVEDFAIPGPTRMVGLMARYVT